MSHVVTAYAKTKNKSVCTVALEPNSRLVRKNGILGFLRNLLMHDVYDGRY